MKKKPILTALLVATSLLWMVERVSACSACFGDKDSPMVHGMNMGILSLLGVVIPLLASFAGFFFYLLWRSKHPLTKAEALRLTKLLE